MDPIRNDTISAQNGAPIKAELSVFCFEEDGVNYAYAPALDLTGYGVDEDEARRSLSDLIIHWLEFRRRDGDLDKVLRGLGWRRTSHTEMRIPMPAGQGEVEIRIAPKTTELAKVRPELGALFNEQRRYAKTTLEFPLAAV